MGKTEKGERERDKRYELKREGKGKSCQKEREIHRRREKKDREIWEKMCKTEERGDKRDTYSRCMK